MAVCGHPVMLVHHVASCRMKMNKSKLQERDYTANKKYKKYKKNMKKKTIKNKNKNIPVRRLSRLPS